MGLFQKTVFNNFVQRFAYNAETELKDAFVRFQARFQTPNVQAKILASKEELYQRTFLREFFEEVLGYIHHPKDNHNLEVEKKNPNDSRKVDGVLLQNQEVRVVIELKSTKTHLDTVVEQAFSYLNAHKHAKYVITSNFTHLRFYLDKKDEFEEFDLFNLTYEEFERMYALLCPATILSNAIDKLDADSLIKQQEITEDFYAKYQNFKDTLCLNMGVNNKQIDKLLIFEKAQKLLDRIIFMYFASSRGLLPTNHVDVIIKEWSDLVKMQIGGTLFDRFKAHFEFINSGITNEKYEIYAYNGGLFAKDAVLDKLKIDNDILVYHCGALLQYDYVSEVDVNILGHIFEHSLSQADQKKQEILQKMQDLEAGKAVTIDNQRKTDGIFYTPSYITNYMVEETLGKLCADKKEALGLTTATEQIDLPALTAYKQWLETVSVLDPACGSGAFLNQVLSFFIKEFNWIETLEMSAIGKKGRRGAYINTILDNNIFGVDLNQESVAITKLSLWLKTAQMYQKLNNLNDNIKVGNSLISDTTLHEKAFDWQKEFPKVMKKGGFTLVVGNPPYVTIKKENILSSLYKWHTDLYLMFFEKCLNDLLQKNGVLGFITPRFWLVNKTNKDFRTFMLTQVDIWQMVETSPFVDAHTECIITLLKNAPPQDDEIVILEDNKQIMRQVNIIKKSYSLRNGSNEILTFLSETAIQILHNIEKNSTYLGKIIESKRGMEIGKSELRTIVGKDILTAQKTLIGQDVNNYSIDFEDTYVSVDAKDYKRLENFFSTELIYLRRVANRLIATTSNDVYAYNKNIYGLKVENTDYCKQYILALLNSKLLDFYYKKKFSLKKVDIFPEIQTYLFEALPIRKISLQDQQIFVGKVDKLLLLKAQLVNATQNWVSMVEQVTKFGKFTKNISEWYLLSWANFSNLLPKNLGLSTKKLAEWRDYFNEEKQKTLPIAQEAQILENEIDALVYALYVLSPEEIRLIENE